MKWLVSVPVWGEEHTAQWMKHGSPALWAAVAHAGADVHLLRHDEPPGPNSACKVGNAIRTAIEQAEVGEAVMTVHAEMVVERNIFEVCERHIDAGAKLVVCPSIRLGQFSADCVWGAGHCAIPPYVFFESAGNLVMHAFELHPIALVKGYGMEYTGPTPSEVISMFSPSEIAIIRPFESMVTEHPIGLSYDRLDRPFTAHDVIRAGRDFFFLKNQHWLFGQQIVIRGKHDPHAQRIANRILNGWTWRDRIPEPVKKVKRWATRSR